IQWPAARRLLPDRRLPGLLGADRRRSAVARLHELYRAGHGPAHRCHGRRRHMTSTTPLQAVIVGAGPAGIRAAQTLAAHGLRPVLIGEGARGGGGRGLGPPPAHSQRPPRALYGSQAARATALHRTLDGLQAQIDYQSDSLVWNAEGGQLDLLHGPTQTTRTLRYGPLIVASGAIDRVLPVPGWTLPGVYTLGAAQVALKFQGCAIGRNVVLMGTGPLLYLVAYQYARCAGTRVA